jgi:hypothetical protein
LFEKRVLRRLFGPEIYETIGDWRKLHNEELRNLYCSSNVIRMIKSMRIRWAGNVSVHWREEKCIQGFSGTTRSKETTRKT